MSFELFDVPTGGAPLQTFQGDVVVTAGEGSYELVGVGDPALTSPELYVQLSVGPLGAPLTMECGGQGALMFFLQTDQGGFLPVDDYVMYDVTFDVPGFDDLSPTGHFYEAQGYPVYVGCGGIGEPDGGFNTVGIAMLLPDALTDVHMVDGVEATLHVSLLPPDDEPVVFDATVTLAVPQYLSLDTCGFGV